MSSESYQVWLVPWLVCRCQLHMEMNPLISVHPYKDDGSSIVLSSHRTFLMAAKCYWPETCVFPDGFAVQYNCLMCLTLVLGWKCPPGAYDVFLSRFGWDFEESVPWGHSFWSDFTARHVYYKLYDGKDGWWLPTVASFHSFDERLTLAWSPGFRGVTSLVAWCSW